MNISSTELKSGLEQYIEIAENDPVLVEESGKIRSVLISYNMYKRFSKLEDIYWAEQAKKAESEGYLGYEASEDVLNLFNTEKSDV